MVPERQFSSYKGLRPKTYSACGNDMPMFRVDKGCESINMRRSLPDVGGACSLKSEQVCRREDVTALRGCVLWPREAGRPRAGPTLGLVAGQMQQPAP